MTNNASGFTLVEFLVAIVILSVGLLGLLQSVNMALSKNMEGNYRNEAVILADDLMMNERSRSFASLTTAVNPPKVKVERSVRGILKNYSVQRVITSRTSLSKEIVINVSWKVKNNQSSHSVSSVVSQYPQ